MKEIRRGFSVLLMLGMFLAGVAIQAEAQTRSSISEREIQTLLRNLTTKLGDFRYDMYDELRNSSMSQSEQRKFNSNLRSLDDKVREFEYKFEDRKARGSDARGIISSAESVDKIVNQNRFGSKAEKTWLEIRTEIDKLGSNYGILPNWNRRNSDYSTTTSNSYNTGLEGTYQIDSSRSENIKDIIEGATKNSSASASDRADLQKKLEAPEDVAIAVRGNSITLATSHSSNPVRFTADGKTRSSTRADGSTISIRATLRGEELVISSFGGETDYTLTFVSIDSGKGLRVTRRITTDYLRQTVFADSIYDKTDAVARIDGMDNKNDGRYSSSDSNDDGYTTTDPNSNPNNAPRTKTPSNGKFIVPNGTVLSGTLDNTISTKVSQNNDRFRMTIDGPSDYQGAVIEGYISGVKKTGKVTGRSKITLNFETITMPNGRTYDFAGVLQSVTRPNGKKINVGKEGEAKGKSRTNKTATRGGIGAGIGAIIGGILGGTKGAIIGATIGGSAGAGTVIAQGRGNVEIEEGSKVTVESTSPNK